MLLRRSWLLDHLFRKWHLNEIILGALALKLMATLQKAGALYNHSGQMTAGTPGTRWFRKKKRRQHSTKQVKGFPVSRGTKQQIKGQQNLRKAKGGQIKGRKKFSKESVWRKKKDDSTEVPTWRSWPSTRGKYILMRFPMKHGNNTLIGVLCVHVFFTAGDQTHGVIHAKQVLYQAH